MLVRLSILGMITPRIGIIGEFDQKFPLHLATNEAIQHGFARHGVEASIEWLPTTARHDLSGFDGFWCSPGGPYRSLEGALPLIQWARVERKPFIGTCAGFQHAVLEFARNVLRIEDAMHAEYDPDASKLFIRRLSCSLVGKRLPIRLKPGSRAAAFYGTDEAVESYYCNFGLNPEYREQLESAGLIVSGWSYNEEASPSSPQETAEARVVELPDHPFFQATLFVPQTNSTPDRPHPLIGAFCESIL